MNEACHVMETLEESPHLLPNYHCPDHGRCEESTQESLKTYHLNAKGPSSKRFSLCSCKLNLLVETTKAKCYT